MPKFYTYNIYKIKGILKKLLKSSVLSIEHDLHTYELWNINTL